MVITVETLAPMVLRAFQSLELRPGLGAEVD